MIKGCLWKEGINGLGVRGFHQLPYKKLFNSAANIHDANYDKGGNRYLADKNFLINCMNVCSNDLQCSTAIIYYIIVRLFGWLFFKYEINKK